MTLSGQVVLWALNPCVMDSSAHCKWRGSWCPFPPKLPLTRLSNIMASIATAIESSSPIGLGMSSILTHRGSKLVNSCVRLRRRISIRCAKWRQAGQGNGRRFWRQKSYLDTVVHMPWTQSNCRTTIRGRFRCSVAIMISFRTAVLWFAPCRATCGMSPVWTLESTSRASLAGGDLHQACTMLWG